MSQNNSTQTKTTKPRISQMSIVNGVLLLAIIVAAGIIALQQSTPTQTQPDGQEYDGSKWIDPPKTVTNFSLIDHEGNTRQLGDLLDKHVLLAFGYTNCPDICPLTVSEFQTIQSELASRSEHITFVLVSIDPERDTPEALSNFFAVRGIETGFVGFTGAAEDLTAISTEYGVVVEQHEQDENGYYIIDHTAAYFLINPDGEWIVRYSYGTPKSVILEDLVEILPR